MSRMPRISNLGVKLTLCLILCLLGVFAALGWQTVRLHRKHLEEMIFSSADRISDTIRRSTRYSMLKNHRDEVYQIINTIGTEPGIGTIRIFNQDGKVSFSTDVREVGTLVDKKAEACTACHAQEEPLTRLNRPDRQRIYTAADGTRLLGLISPIENESSCATAECHAHPPSQQVLGVLDVTLSLAQVDESIAQSSGRMLAVFAAAMLIVPIFVGVPIWYLIHRPIRQLTLRTQQIAAGKLDGEILITSRDEIGELAASFNHMTQELNRANVQITEWNRTLESRVAQKTQELKRATEQMVQVERMASIGKLAAIVAHEVNNPLTGILTYAKLLLKKTKSNGEGFAGMADAQQYLEVIASESARCGELVKGLLQFARQSPVNLRENDVNELIREAVRLVQHKIDLMNLRLRLRLQEAPLPLICDAQLIKQALVALLINACEAVRPGEGVIEVESRCNPETDTVDVLVRDNGAGMDEDVQRHIFEPFFTTKEAGKGVGLGLAVVYGIVSQHSGTIDVRSCPGQGTTVALRLPAQERGVESEAVKASKGEP
jgi:two-component system NtrC family sensor kinase